MLLGRADRLELGAGSGASHFGRLLDAGRRVFAPLANGGRRRADNQSRRHRRFGLGPVLGRVLDVPHGPDGRVDVIQDAQSFYFLHALPTVVVVVWAGCNTSCRCECRRRETLQSRRSPRREHLCRENWLMLLLLQVKKKKVRPFDANRVWPARREQRRQLAPMTSLSLPFANI